MWYRLRDRHIEGWNITENLQIDIQKYAQKIFDKIVKAIFSGGRRAFSTNGARVMLHSYAK